MNVGIFIHNWFNHEEIENIVEMQDFQRYAFKNQFHYFKKRISNFFLFFFILGEKLSVNDYKLMFSLLKSEEIYSLVSLHPLVGLKEDDLIGEILLYDDIIDFSQFSSNEEILNNTTNTLVQKPLFCPHLRRRLLSIILKNVPHLRDSGTVIAFNQKRNETAAEGLMLQRWDIDGISSVISHEAFLSKKYRIHFAPIGIFNRHSTNLQELDFDEDGNYSNNDIYSQTMKEILLLITNNVSLIQEVPSICDKLEFKEHLV